MNLNTDDRDSLIVTGNFLDLDWPTLLKPGRYPCKFCKVCKKQASEVTAAAAAAARPHKCCSVVWSDGCLESVGTWAC